MTKIDVARTLAATDDIVDADDADALIGERVNDRYVIESLLGYGGIGLVYKARHLTLDKYFAVKVLRPEVSRDGEIILRFKQEAQAAGAIGHEHIVEVLDFGTLPDGSAFQTMEFLDGQSLSDAIDPRWGMEPHRAVHIIRQVCEAVGAAHRKGIVHRDLKPDNVMLIKRRNESDFAKVLDFGVAKVMCNTEKLTQTGEVFGTPHYMAPEQCVAGEVDPRADIYAIGVMLYQMTTGCLPFTADTVMGIVAGHLQQEPVPPQALKATIPDTLQETILRALAKHPDDRYQTVDELLADLDDFAGVGSTFASGLRMRLPDPKKTPSTGMASARIVGKPASQAQDRTRLFVGAVGLSTLLLTGGLVGGFWLGSREAPGTTVASAAPSVEGSSANHSTTAAPAAASASGAESAANPVPKAAPRRKTHVTTDPANAEIWWQSVMLGNTPIDVPLPKYEDEIQLELRQPGFETRQLVLTPSTASEVKVQLRKIAVDERRTEMSRRRRIEATSEEGGVGEGGARRSEASSAERHSRASVREAGAGTTRRTLRGSPTEGERVPSGE